MAEISEKSWELSFYELHRQPNEAITDNKEIAVSAKSLQAELLCPICLELLTSTMTTKECLHRFCAECIITALRSGNKECPTCRKKLVSKRSLRPDPNFDMLVAKIFPDRVEYEEQQDKALAILSKNHSQQLMSTIGDALKAQTAHSNLFSRPRKRNLIENDEELTNPEQEEKVNEEQEIEKEQTVVTKPRKRRKVNDSVLLPNEIEIVFKPHNELDEDILARIGENQTRYIKTLVTASIDHLCKYLVMRLEVDLDIEDVKDSSEEGKENIDTHSDKTLATKEDTSKPETIKNMKIFVRAEQCTELTGPETLEMVVEDFNKTVRPLELSYKFDLAKF